MASMVVTWWVVSPPPPPPPSGFECNTSFKMMKLWEIKLVSLQSTQTFTLPNSLSRLIYDNRCEEMLRNKQKTNKHWLRSPVLYDLSTYILLRNKQKKTNVETKTVYLPIPLWYLYSFVTASKPKGVTMLSGARLPEVITWQKVSQQHKSTSNGVTTKKRQTPITQFFTA